MKHIDKYNNYQPSKVDYIKDIPSHWEVIKLKYISENIKTGSTPSSKKGDYFTDGEINWFSPSDFHNNFELKSSIKKATIRAKEDGELKLFRKGAVLLTGIGSVGKVGITLEESSCNQQINAIEFNKKCLDKFGLYLLYSIGLEINKFAKATILPIFNQDETKSLKVCLPPLSEQSKIINFLNKKNIEIETFIKEKNDLITLFNEQKRVLINKVLTKGTNDKVEYKDSETYWVGNIPKHWTPIKVKYLLDNIKIGPFGSMIKSKFIQESGFKIFGQENVINQDFKLGEKYIDKTKFNELKNYAINSGDVVITMMGTTGKAQVVPSNIEKGIMDSHLIRLRPNNLILNTFLSLLINDSKYIYDQIKFNSKGSIMEGLNSTIVKELKVVLPPIDEQHRLLKYLNKEVSKINQVIKQTKKEIDLIEEYKISLIGEVVTGKIKVF